MLLHLTIFVFGPAGFMGTVAKRLFLAEAAGAPGVGFASLYLHRSGLAFGGYGQLFVVHAAVVGLMKQ
jgi:hypothetical protein